MGPCTPPTCTRRVDPPPRPNYPAKLGGGSNPSITPSCVWNLQGKEPVLKAGSILIYLLSTGFGVLQSDPKSSQAEQFRPQSCSSKKCCKGGIMQALYVTPAWACCFCRTEGYCTKQVLEGTSPLEMGQNFARVLVVPSEVVQIRCTTSGDVPNFRPIRGQEIISHKLTDKLTENQHAVRPCSTSNAYKK